MKKPNPTPSEIRAARLSAGLTQQAAADLLGVHVQTWKRWEADNGNPSTMRRMSNRDMELFLLKSTRQTESSKCRSL